MSNYNSDEDNSNDADSNSEADTDAQIDSDNPIDFWVRTGDGESGRTQLVQLAQATVDAIDSIDEDLKPVLQSGREGIIADEFAKHSASIVVNFDDVGYGDVRSATRALTSQSGDEEGFQFYQFSVIDGMYKDHRTKVGGRLPASWKYVREMYDQSAKDLGRDGAAAYITSDESSEYVMTTADDEKLWRYDPGTGIYHDDGEQHIRTLLQTELGHHYSTHEYREILDKVKGQSYVPRDDLNGGKGRRLICVENGVLDISDPANPELHEHSPEHHFIQYIPAEYNPNATFEGGSIDSFLNDVTRRPEDKRVLLEYLGFCLWPTYEPASFLMIFGQGSNGKTVWEKVCEAFLGNENTSNVDLQQFTSNNFAASDLYGKFANIGGDMPGAKVHDLGPLKALTGGDEFRAEEKFEKAFTFENRAKMVFTVNYPPVLGERGHAIKRRILPIHFSTRFTPKGKPGPDLRPKQKLMAELTTDEELSALLNEVLTRLAPVVETGDFSLPESYDERLAFYEKFADMIRQTSDRCFESQPASLVTKDTAYEAYRALCRERDESPKAKQTFYKTFGTVGEIVATETRVRDPEQDGEQTRCLDRIGLTEEGERLCPNHLIEQSRRLTAKRYGRADGTVPLEYVTPDAGYIDVKARLRTARTPGDEVEALRFRGSLEDSSGTLPLIGFESDVTLEELREHGLVAGDIGSDPDPTETPEGHIYRFTDVRAASGTSGETQLRIVPETDVERVEDEIQMFDSELSKSSIKGEC